MRLVLTPLSCNLWVVSEPRSRMLAQHGRRKAPHGQLRGLERGWFLTESQHAPGSPEHGIIFQPWHEIKSRYSTYSTSRGNCWSVVPVSACPGFYLKLWLPYYQSTDQQMSRILPLPSGDKRGPCLRRYWLTLQFTLKPVLYSPHRPSPSPG